MSYEGYFSFPSITAIVAAAVAILWFLFSKREIQATRIDATVPDDNTEASTSESATSSVSAGGVYEVFLSFRGIDTRKGFTDFLYMDLVGAGIRTFKDDNELRVGEDISLELLRSIRESKISIPIFSKNYASSKWCLRELEEMVECHNNGSQMIYPLFYDVDPSDVRNQRGSYEKAFRQHKKKFSKEVVQRWRDALKIVGGLKGLELNKETNGHQGEFVKLVVEDVLIKLEKKYKHVPENLVGMDFHIQELMRLVEFESKDVRIIGIHGMGGLGKTTIATVIYNKLSQHFDDLCFLDDVRENSKDIVKLQKQLISKIRTRKDKESFSNANGGRERIKAVVFRKKLLIVLDDVDNISQVTNLMGHHSWFGLQSRIILTTRCKDVLDVIEFKCQNEDPYVIYKSYNPEIMDDADSLRLFSKHAFKKDSPLEGYASLSMGVVSIAAGLPLVLVVLGSTFYTIRDKEFWEDRLRQLKNTPNRDVMETLKFSFEALENVEKQIFLDIACFFIGYNKTRPCYMWESCGLYPRTVISVLVSKSLITVDDDDKLSMHDQLRDLGRQIVREEGLHNNNPAEQSRLWCSDEAMQILETHQGTSSVNAMRFQACEKVVATYFHNLPNLKYLHVKEMDIVDGYFKNLLPSLRWLCIFGGKFSTNYLNMKNLVILELSRVHFSDDWNELKANNLKVLNLSWCENLLTLPNLSNLTKLVELRLVYCDKLIKIQGLEKLESLKILDAKESWSLMKIGKLEGLIYLEHLDLGDCNKLQGFGDLSKLNKLKVLKAPRLEDTGDLSHFRFLKELEICYSNMVEIQGVATLESLQVVTIFSCDSLERLPDLPNMGILKVIDISYCDKLQEVEGLGVIKSLESLSISNCSQLQKIPNLQNFKRLKSLTFKFVELNEIQGLEEVKSLEKLEISFCDQLSEIPNLGSLKKLRILNIPRLKKINEIDGLEELKSLESLDISGCKSIKALPDLSAFQKLKKLDVCGCVKLYEILGIQELKYLTNLNICGCEGLDYLPDLPNVKIRRGPNPCRREDSSCLYSN